MKKEKVTRSLSVVVPVFKSAGFLESLYNRVSTVLSKSTDQWEIILVDDASNDGTFDKMKELHVTDNRVKLIRFAQNMGQHHATLCGIQHATGDYVITLDDDLQNPPEEIPHFINQLEKGYALVIGQIIGKKRHNAFRNIASSIIQKLISKILAKPKNLSLSSYRAMTKNAASAMGSFKGNHVYLPAIIFYSVPHEKISNIPVKHVQRMDGKSNYTLRKLLKLSSYLLINHSKLPLRLVTTWGFCISIASFGYAFFIFLKAVFFGSLETGWPSLAVLISFLSGNILFCLGILGEYISRLVDENTRTIQFPIFEKHF